MCCGRSFSLFLYHSRKKWARRLNSQFNITVCRKFNCCNYYVMSFTFGPLRYFCASPRMLCVIWVPIKKVRKRPGKDGALWREIDRQCQRATMFLAANATSFPTGRRLTAFIPTQGKPCVCGCLLVS